MDNYLLPQTLPQTIEYKKDLKVYDKRFNSHGRS
jgi:hypothetical protein